MAPLLAAIAVSIIAMVGIVGLVVRADAGRAAEVKLDGVASEVNELQNTPWRLVDDTAGRNRQVAVQMAGLERAVGGQLAGLERDAPIPALAPLRRLVRVNFGLLAAEFASLVDDRTEQAQALEGRRFASQDRLRALLDQAAGTYHDDAVSAEFEAAVGSVVIVLLLILCFALLFRRAVVAHRAAESLAADLARSQRHLEQAQRVASVGSWEFYFSDQTLICSTQHARLHGWTDRDPPATAEIVLAAIAEEDRERVEAAFVATQQPGDTLAVEYSVNVGDGRRLLHLDAEVVADADGRPIGLIGTCQDVSERFRRIEAERANQAKSEFLSRISHELRTPLNAILGFGQLLRMTELDEQQAANIDHVVVAGGHLLDLINEVLDISRIESGGLRLSPEPVNVDAVIQEAIDLITPVAGPRAIAVNAAAGGPSPWAEADVQRLKQVLLNLLSNAIKYNCDGGRVDVRAGVADGRVRIVVADDGPGIAAGLQEKLFQPFERLGAERTAIEGTGLGLALSKGMIEAMGGTITVQSTPGEGSSFTVELQATAPPVDGPAPAARPAGQDWPAGDQVVLCIEDNPSNLELIAQVLSKRPRVELVTALQGTLGIDLARQHLPQLVLLDMNLPDITGGEVLARLKADPGTRHIPVVVVSADASNRRIEHLLDVGAEAYLTKPINVSKLLELVDTALGQAPTPAASCAA